MKVKLEKVMNALFDASYEIEYFYSVETEKIIIIYDNMVDGIENEKLADEIRDSSLDKYIMLPTLFDINQYRIMQKFISYLEDEKVQNILWNAIEGKGAFRRFKDQAIRLGVINQWYVFRDEYYEKIARNWCEINGIEIEE